ncbi:glycosyltransferase [Rhodopila sp.]|uniref:glycosyltransferase n=1 Tax=Rhodopila sp. TaxID=2480087 RepID=UPI003D10706F
MTATRRQDDGTVQVPAAIGGEPRVLIAAFSARYALGQLLDEMFGALCRRLDCRVLVPTNYAGRIPERSLYRAPCGVSKIGGILASINPVAHWKVVAALLRAKPDVVHILTGEGYLWAISLVVAARLAGTPVVVTLHDPDPHPGNVFERLNAIVRRPVLALTGTVHLLASRHLERAKTMAGHARFVVTPHGSLAGQFLRHRKCGVKREELVLFFGRIQQYKGIDVLLQAMQMLPATTRLAIAGPGVIEVRDQQVADALGERVELHNKYLDDQEVAGLMQRASVVALPYRHVTQSSVPAIAAAFGCRLVATGLGNFVEEIPRLGGVVVDPGDASALAAALRQAVAAGPVAGTNSPTFDDLSPLFVTLYRSSAKPGFDLRHTAEQGLSR